MQHASKVNALEAEVTDLEAPPALLYAAAPVLPGLWV